jgi:hypothetical protein
MDHFAYIYDLNVAALKAECARRGIQIPRGAKKVQLALLVVQHAMNNDENVPNGNAVNNGNNANVNNTNNNPNNGTNNANNNGANNSAANRDAWAPGTIVVNGAVRCYIIS